MICDAATNNELTGWTSTFPPRHVASTNQLCIYRLDFRWKKSHLHKIFLSKIKKNIFEKITESEVSGRRRKKLNERCTLRWHGTHEGMDFMLCHLNTLIINYISPKNVEKSEEKREHELRGNGIFFHIHKQHEHTQKLDLHFHAIFRRKDD